MATFFFGIQIYCDFSGYSDIAIGAARVLGFRLMRNFNKPFFATSISDFWARWHISLSTWFRDYVYFPLGGNRVSRTRLYFNILFVFLLSGLWHGAGWTFLLWGALNGVLLIVEKIAGVAEDQRQGWLLTCFRMTVVGVAINVTWIFFRAASVADGWYVVTHLFGEFRLYSMANEHYLNLDLYNRIVALLSVLILFATEYLQGRISLLEKLSGSAVYIKWPVYAGLLLAILLWGVFEGRQQFIYFQF